MKRTNAVTIGEGYRQYFDLFIYEEDEVSFLPGYESGGMIDDVITGRRTAIL